MREKINLYKKNDIGYVIVPYTIVNVKSTINGETVWYKNRLKNLLLKIKHLFKKPKALKFFNAYQSNPIQ